MVMLDKWTSGGSKKAKNQKLFFSLHKLKRKLPTEKKIGSLAPRTTILAQAECRADLGPLPEMGFAGVLTDFRPKTGKLQNQTKHFPVGLGI